MKRVMVKPPIGWPSRPGISSKACHLMPPAGQVSLVVPQRKMDRGLRTMMLNQYDLRLVGFWAGDCAERVLALFEAKAPADTRPREAIAGIRAFARGEKRTARLRSLALAASAAAREVGDPVAAAAARAAGLAASSAYMHPLPTLDQAK